MAVTLHDKLVVAISSRALFNFEEENRLFEAGVFAQGIGLRDDIAHLPHQLRAGEMLTVERAGQEGGGGFDHVAQRGRAEAFGKVAEGAARLRIGEAVVNLARLGIYPRDIMTKKAFENAIAVLNALGGSTNAVLHLLAIANEAGVALDLDDFKDRKSVV